MPDIRSPLEAHIQKGTFGGMPGDIPGLSLSAGESGRLIQFAGWSNFEDMMHLVAEELGLSDWRNFRRAGKGPDVTSFRLAPDRLWVMGAAAVPRESSHTLTVLDLSHARWRISVSGVNAEDLMARLAPIDFSLEVFAEDDFVQTGIHHVGVLIHRSAQQVFDIYVPYTWAVSIWDTVTEAASPLRY